MAPETPPTAPALAPFTSISAKAYEHPADRAATAVLHRLPFFDPLVKKLLELTIERRMMQLLLGNSVRLGETQLPRIWSAHRAAYTTLDIAGVPTLHIIQTPVANAVTIGAKRPTVLLQSGIVPMLDETELRAVLAHEAGHVLSEHVRYRTTLELLLRFTLPRLPLMGRVPLQALIAALLAWYRAAELSCDRAAALVTRDPLTVCRVLMVIAAGAEAKRLDLDVFMKQGEEYREKGSGLERLSRLLLDLNVTHPMPVRRIHELMEWVRSGEYDRIVGGSYVTRDEPLHARAEAGDAVAHYAERFKNVFRDAGESVGDVGKQLSDWLRGNGEHPDDED